MRTAPRLFALAAGLAVAGGAGGALALGGGGPGVGASGTGTVVAGTILTAPSGPPIPVGVPRAPLAEQTHPSIIPRRGSRRTRFAVRLTLADAPGHSGVVATSYSLGITVPPKKPIQRCSPRAPLNIDAGIAHDVVRLELGTPARGWCAGRYTVAVLLQRGPSCPKPSPGQPPTPCPEFASQELNVGTAHFTVATKH